MILIERDYTPEYWYPKITVLCHYFFKSETESDKIIAMQVYGTILLYGWKGLLEKNQGRKRARSRQV